jgi:VWFA-related protein
MNRPIVAILLGLACAVPVMAQADESATTLRLTSRAVLVDVIVSDSSGKPVTQLSRDAFSVTEQGKPQAISFFEENGNTPPARSVEMPKMPPDVFTNFSPFPEPPAVNVLLLDSLNTRMENQSNVHQQALQFLKTAKPGTRMAIFTMGLGLHFIQGFNDDPSVLLAALSNKKNNAVETSVMLKGQEETNAQEKLLGIMSTPEGNGASAASPGMIAALQGFIKENDTSRSIDRIHLTLENLQRLAAFLQGFPGRKNIIWFSEKAPALFVTGSDAAGGVASGTAAIGDEIKKTLAMLAAARAAIYPVDARGTSVNAQYMAENNPAVISTAGEAISEEDMDRNSDQANAQILADQSGGKAFANTNGLSNVIGKIASTSSHFYTLSYSPTNAKMDGTFRNIKVKVQGGEYKLSYRRGYFAVEDALPGRSLAVRNQEVQKLASKNPGAVDPLLPFMDLGMPQSQQILYKILVVPTAAAQNEPADKKNQEHYKVDFAIDLKDLNLNLDTDGLHKGTLNISLIVYDRYGNIVSREDHLVALNIKPDAYAMFQNTGVQLHAQLAVPNGNYWLRSGIYDRASRKVGTMEIPLSAVKPLQTAAK